MIDEHQVVDRVHAQLLSGGVDCEHSRYIHMRHYVASVGAPWWRITNTRGGLVFTHTRRGVSHVYTVPALSEDEAVNLCLLFLGKNS